MNLFDPELQLVNTKPVIKKNKRIVNLNFFKVQIILILDYKKNDREIFHSSAKLIASDSDNDEAFKPIH